VSNAVGRHVPAGKGCVPELLRHPIDSNIESAGLAALVARSSRIPIPRTAPCLLAAECNRSGVCADAVHGSINIALCSPLAPRSDQGPWLGAHHGGAACEN
jgi:hypothetical protein